MKQRTLKFRAWSIAQKKMYDRVLAGPGAPCSLVWDDEREWVNFDEASGVIMQYVGAQDADGAEVYEFDIVADKAGKHLLVSWYVDGWHTLPGETGGFSVSVTALAHYGLRVVGNLFEHPEMVQKNHWPLWEGAS